MKLLKGYEVEWCSDVPLVDGENDLDNAKMHVQDFPLDQLEQARAFAREKLKVDWFGSVRITEFELVPFEPGYPGLTREYMGEPEYIDE